MWTVINSTGYTHNELLIFTELLMWEQRGMLGNEWLFVDDSVLKHQVMSSASDVWTQTIILTITLMIILRLS